MFKKNYLFAISLLIPLVLYSQQSYAASESECGIWLCAPAGFPDGCSAPHSAMIKTNKKKIGKTYLIGGSGSSIPNYPVVTNNEYYSLYQSGSLNNLKKYVETINNDRQKGIDFDNEYREY